MMLPAKAELADDDEAPQGAVGLELAPAIAGDQLCAAASQVSATQTSVESGAAEDIVYVLFHMPSGAVRGWMLNLLSVPVFLFLI